MNALKERNRERSYYDEEYAPRREYRYESEYAQDDYREPVRRARGFQTPAESEKEQLWRRLADSSLDVYDYRKSDEYRRVGSGAVAMEQQAERSYLRPQSKSKSIKKGKMSLKVKAIIGVYVAVLAVVIALVIANAIPSAGANIYQPALYLGYDLPQYALGRIVTENGIFCIITGILLG